jgi:hypothetical protein
MFSEGFQPVIPAIKLLKTCALYCAATGIDVKLDYNSILIL